MPNNEYIKRSDARAYVRHAHGKGLNLMECIDAIPAADVAPVRHAYWESEPGKMSRFCSGCWADEPYKFADENAKVYDYCPHCGAKMDGEDDDAD